MKEEKIAPTTRLVGTVVPQRRATVAAEVSGWAIEFPVSRGDYVRKGDVICRLRDAQHRFAYLEAEARYADAQAVLAVARAELDKANFEENRIRNLRDTAEKERVVAKADLDAAQARVAQAEASSAAADAVRQRLSDSLARTEVRAPFDGFVVTRRAELGEWVQQGGPVVELIDLSTARVRLNVPEAYIDFNEVGVEVTVSIDALSREFASRVSRVVPDADPQARTFSVDVDIRNPDFAIKAGMFARGNMPCGPIANRLVVPKDAIVSRGPMNFIFVIRQSVDGAIADMRPVTIISEVIDRVAVDVPGLQAGDIVVTRGNEMMYAPGPVVIMSRTASQPARSDTPATQPVVDEGGATRESAAGDTHSNRAG
ncbi:MAG: efflux RND transporter periplasmic adaptor subunit [Phycisphaerae bacterium]|nr:efflux RND transporter periplasmic adaptor subunit [Phycisphaerae bacterium]